ncbi:MAG: ABC transporter ATP-binding protein, partial [Bacteroidota bacterium]|nr:ABC transporter ATP-binding protein [Bacteroidota bacterium]
MKHLRAVNKYFWKYKWRLLLGLLFVVLSNYFRILSPQVTGYVVNSVEQELVRESRATDPHPVSSKPERRIIRNQKSDTANYDILVRKFIRQLNSTGQGFGTKVAISGITLLILAMIGGAFMFLMRQTIIVMSRHIEFDQKNEIFRHYQLLDTSFYRSHSTGDLMSRMAEDVSRVRMYTGPAIMYLGNLLATIGFSLYFMIRKDALLTLYVLAPLPVLAVTIYMVNNIIHKRSERIQALLSNLTTNAQESYSGIRVIKSFVQERAMIRFFTRNSEEYRKNAINLAKVEAVYFPSMGLIIGLSTLLTIMLGGFYVIRGTHHTDLGTITEFIIYITMLTFPVSAIGWVASMFQRASASQKRLNEFLETVPTIQNPLHALNQPLSGNISFEKVDFIYPNTGIHAIRNFSLKIRKGEKIAVIGKTGSGKTTLAQLLLRFYDPTQGVVRMDGQDIKTLDIRNLRSQIGYVPQDVFLFSDTVTGNILFSSDQKTEPAARKAAGFASVDQEVLQFSSGFDTLIGERGVTLSGGQKQRISIARALSRDHGIVIFDDCLSAVDSRTEKEIINRLYAYLQHKTALIITHRIFALFEFDRIIVLDNGSIIETGTHTELLAMNGY